jgi:YegS/Rv2252/BmrU family lipid kinase
MRLDSSSSAAARRAAPDPAAAGASDLKMRFIFNPCSGRRRNARLLPLVRELIAERQLDADLVTTDGPGHATYLAAQAVAGGCRRVIAVGGDGTMNEVAQALVDAPAALALVPCGSGNGLARHLGLPAAPEAALELAADPATGIILIDTGTVNGRPFFNAMGFGLDADVSQRFNRLTRRGLPAYARTALAAFFQRRPERCVVAVDGRSQTLDILLIAVANSDQYGNGAFVAPGARVDDGRLDLVAVRPVGAAGAIALGIRLFAGSFDRSPCVRHLQGERFLIERPTAGIVHTDGEIHATAATLDIAVRPRSLSVVASGAPAPADLKPRLAAAETRCLPFALNL